MVISVVQSIDFFPLSKVKKLVVRVVFAPSRDFLVLKRSFKACPESGRDRLMDGLNMDDLCDKKLKKTML